MIIPRPYQRQCVDAFYAYYDGGAAGHGLIVVPTAGGKSLIIGQLATEIKKSWPTQRILILSHVTELIQQNHDKVLAWWPHAPAGVYAAKLKRRQADLDIITASVQSVYNRADELGHRDLVFIDEAHLLQFGNMGMYGVLLAALFKINPYMKICGFTATDYRLDGGLLTEGEGKLFDDVIIEIPISLLLEEGYLTPPTSKSTIVQADLKGVQKVAGEFNQKQMAARFDQEAFINAALDADMQYLQTRRSPAFFCASVENAEHVAHAATQRGIYCEVLDGETDTQERANKLRRYRNGDLRALASVGVMTTGTDLPNMDAVVMFRATTSPGLYQQIIGRGFRVVYAPGYDITTKEGRLEGIKNGPKPDFLVLDHGGNIERHGPICHVEKPQRKEPGEKQKKQQARARICDICRTAWPIDTKVCGLCQHVMLVERDPTSSLTIEASNADILGNAFASGEEARWFDVEKVGYGVWVNEKRPDALMIHYQCGLMAFKEFIEFESPHKFVRDRARRWWKERAIDAARMPGNAEQAMSCSDDLRAPARVQAVKRGKHFAILRYEFNRVIINPSVQGSQRYVLEV